MNYNPNLAPINRNEPKQLKFVDPYNRNLDDKDNNKPVNATLEGPLKNPNILKHDQVHDYSKEYVIDEIDHKKLIGTDWEQPADPKELLRTKVALSSDQNFHN